LEIALDLGYLSPENYELLEKNRSELAIMLLAFVRGIKKRKNKL